MENSMEEIKGRIGLDHQADFKHMQRKMVRLMSSWTVSLHLCFQIKPSTTFPSPCLLEDPF